MIAVILCPFISADESKKEKHGREAIDALEKSLALASTSSRRIEIEREISELRLALENNHRASVPDYVDLAEMPIRLADALFNPVGHGKTPAANLVEHDSTIDLSLLDPVSSTYWRRPQSIRSADLRIGFDRPKLPDYSGIFLYAAAKRAGNNPGCVVSDGNRQIKVKFAETRSEPFASRIFHALGYNVDPTDFAPALKIKYDRRFFLEFNSRRPMRMSAGMLFIPMVFFDLQPRHDPFAFIDHAVLKNGKTLPGTKLKPFLIAHPQRKHAETIDDEFRINAEQQIDFLVTMPANVQVETPHTHNVGPWDFDAAQHRSLRELRGAGVLAAWLGWWDSRFENTRVRTVKTPDGVAVKHFWTDLGGGLGRARGTFSHSCEHPNDFGWSFTRATSKKVNGKRVTGFEIKGYEPIEDTPAFTEMTVDDARWMARLIGQLSERQIVGALEASGFSPADVQIYAAKLVSRRDNLIRDLQLTSEIALLRPNKSRQTIGPDRPKLISKSR